MTVLVVDQTLVMVFSVHGLPCPGSHQPPQRSSHGAAVDVNRDARARVVARVELFGEHVPDRLEPGVAGSLHIHHGSQPFLVETT